MKQIVFLFCVIAICACMGKVVYWAKQGFSPRRFSGPISNSLIIWNSEADQAIKQTYRFLGRGRQSFAFSSLDGKYVLKLVRNDKYRIPLWMRSMPLSHKRIAKMRAARDTKEQFTVSSMRIAYEELREETGIVAIHLAKTEDLGRELTLVDSLGFTHHLPADKTPFIIQAKQPILVSAFLKAVEENDVAKREKILDAFIDVVVARGNKGIADKDDCFYPNYGFDGQKGYQIDLGCLYHKNDPKSCVLDTMNPVRNWLQKTDPSMLDHFDKTLESRLK